MYAVTFGTVARKLLYIGIMAVKLHLICSFNCQLLFWWISTCLLQEVISEDRFAWEKFSTI
jgi:hypothetical protein